MLFCLQYVSIYAAYLYDAVMLYARALDEVLKKYDVVTQDILDSVAHNGTLIIEMMKNRTYESECGFTFSINPMQTDSGTVWGTSKFVGDVKVI